MTPTPTERFLPAFAVLLTLLAAAYIAGVTFGNVPQANQRVVDTVLGFLLGTVISAVVGFYFASTKDGHAAQQALAQIAAAPSDPPPPPAEAPKP